MQLGKPFACLLLYSAVLVTVVAASQDRLSGDATASMAPLSFTSGLIQGNKSAEGNALNPVSNNMNQKQQIHVVRIERDLAAKDIDDPLWSRAESVDIDRYWSGEPAPASRHAKAQLLWSGDALYVRFICAQKEPLVVSATPKTDAKTLGLWDRDVAEIFIGPDLNQPERYYEFEAAPTGEWVDLSIRQLPEKRETDFEFHSGVSTASRIEGERVIMSMRIPWKVFGFVPRKGQQLAANLFRCIGDGPNRGYLAWSPTRTKEPNFHVPAALGRLVFN
ncbi:MAG: hypothetical protein QOH96_2949 [Blastocatellia bacterium]|nr:hypothetical protein [Blastocatellia bacterium]